MRVLGFSLISIFLFSACGKSHVNSSPENISTANPDGGRILVSEASVYCENSEHCPGSVGLLTFYVDGPHSSMAGMCTTFLVGGDLALTNSHCVPDEIKNGSQSPSGKMKILFPETNTYAGETVGVEKVMSFTDLSGAEGKKPDYALLKLSRAITDRETLSFSQEGAPDELAFQIYSVTPQSDHAVVGSLQVSQCSTMMNSALQPSYQSPFTSVISFSDCMIYHGNSGSPIIDTNGKIRGIVQAAVEEKFFSQVEQEFQVSPIKPLNLGTNAACMSIPELGLAPVNTVCNQKIPQMDVGDGAKIISANPVANPNFQASVKSKLKKMVDDWSKKSAPFSAQWTSLGTQRGTDLVGITVPACLTPGTPAPAASFDVPTYRVKTAYDSKLRLAATVNSSPDASANVSVNGMNVSYRFSGSTPQNASGIGYCSP